MNPAEYERMFLLEDRHWWFLARRELLRLALLRFPPPVRKGVVASRLLDVGCGTGGTLIRLPEQQRRNAVGLDVEPRALAFSRDRGLQSLALGSATALPFPDASFDAAIALDVIEHIDDDAAACREIARVLAPGGRFYVSVPAYPALWSHHDIALMHRRRYLAAPFRDLLVGAGFTVEYQTHVVSALLPIAFLVRRLQYLRRRHRPPVADISVPLGANALLYRLHLWEAQQALRTPLPFGLSIFAVARNPNVEAT